MAPVYSSSRTGRSSSRGPTASRPSPQARLMQPRRGGATADHRKSAPSIFGSQSPLSSDPVRKGAVCPPFPLRDAKLAECGVEL
ncbi:hypothetical protein NDU88_009335 [Pleurodeles waltl]|uniref:Uncharacterized protein n=1 Tax=Pleurodeles waltl TaxID=8319 RepID=A0AAV7QX88_PLEWA|nr:hypothetical protein NDU88_009335 [Pleurodeles waltl]